MRGYRICLIRHGLTEANEKGIYIGSTDLPLSEKGANELLLKKDSMEYPYVDRVYTSPLRRCTGTADILYPYSDTVVVDELRELNMGIFENKSYAELMQREDYKAWLKGGKDSRPPEGESLQEMTARTFKAMHSIINDMMHCELGRCAIITHAGIISNLLVGFGLPKYDPKYLQSAPGEGFEIMVNTQMWLNSQAFEILGYCPYPKREENEE
ncbi:MAG: histidine phosphatase family protein [Ruminococcus sp.]|nr:histidine phosphatase family protein [Ruminococcus sp.]